MQNPAGVSTPTLNAKDVRLEPVSMAHTEALQPQFADWEIIRHLSAKVPWPYPSDGVAQFFESDLLPRIAAGKAHAWALIPKDAALNPTGEAAGLLEWRCDPEATDQRGFWIGRAYQGRGLMTQAVAAFQDWIFLELEQPLLVMHSATRNTASARVKEKTGAEIVAVVELAHHEGVTETYRWELTKARWEEFRATCP
ncbi:MAG: GNAT family N-acetyltransferase [Myxococcales bacterium]|nr:GNAT family N-acetyltransferase [Myxococcales bacterium]